MWITAAVLACALGVPAATTPATKTWAITFRTGPGWKADVAPGRQAHFADHSKNLERLRKEGRLLLGGRYGELGLILIAAPDEAAARQEIDRDPSVAAGTFVADVKEWRTFMGGCTDGQAVSSPKPAE